MKPFYVFYTFDKDSYYIKKREIEYALEKEFGLKFKKDMFLHIDFEHKTTKIRLSFKRKEMDHTKMTHIKKFCLDNLPFLVEFKLHDDKLYLKFSYNTSKMVVY